MFDGDPLAEPALLSRRDAVWLVLQGGTPVAGAALEPAAPGADRSIAAALG